jgi:hypothetical protein
MKPRLAFLALVAALSVATVSADQRATRERGIVVAASMASGVPATGLTAADFVVREDGVVREVIKIGPAPPPSHVLLLVDDSDSMQFRIAFLRSALAKFIPRMAAATPAPQLSLMTFGERPTRRVAFTPNAVNVEQAAKKLFPINGAGAYFLQGIVEACQDLRKRAAPSPVIVAFVAEQSPEFSNDSRKQVATALESAGASLWVVALQQTSNADRSPEGYERAAVLGDVTVMSGGMTRMVLGDQSIEPGFDGIASLLTSRTLVLYGRPESTIPPKAIEVSVKRPDVRVISSRWIR